MGPRRAHGGGRLVALVGPTASGKTDAALEVASPLGAEIVSVDSMLVYRGMDIGTAKPTPAQRARVPHHLIDVAEPNEPFTAARYRSLAEAAIADVHRRRGAALLAGGSGLYYRAVVDRLRFPGTDADTRAELEREASTLGAAPLYARLRALDPRAAEKIEPANVRRTVRALEVAAVTGRPFSTYAAAWEEYPDERVTAIGVEIDAAALRERIERRVGRMLQLGFLDEVRRLLDRGLGPWLVTTQAIGYAELVRHLDGSISLDEAATTTVRRTRQFARRQLAWFRRDPRIRWIRAGSGGAMDSLDEIRDALA
jgi:tRNA dimethylallyltransferase